jgi:hypothetical protein
MRIIAAPLLYLSWATFVVLTLVTTYLTEPIAFYYGTLILAWMSGAILVAGVFTMLTHQQLARSARAVIAISLGINVTAIVLALRTLGEIVGS